LILADEKVHAIYHSYQGSRTARDKYLRENNMKILLSRVDEQRTDVRETLNAKATTKSQITLTLQRETRRDREEETQ
jgi:hypothetical protein